MKKKTFTKMALTKETLRALHHDEAHEVVGGATKTAGASCNSLCATVVTCGCETTERC